MLIILPSVTIYHSHHEMRYSLTTSRPPLFTFYTLSGFQGTPPWRAPTRHKFIRYSGTALGMSHITE